MKIKKSSINIKNACYVIAASIGIYATHTNSTLNAREFKIDVYAGTQYTMYNDKIVQDLENVELFYDRMNFSGNIDFLTNIKNWFDIGLGFQFETHSLLGEDEKITDIVQGKKPITPLARFPLFSTYLILAKEFRFNKHHMLFMKGKAGIASSTTFIMHKTGDVGVIHIPGILPGSPGTDIDAGVIDYTQKMDNQGRLVFGYDLGYMYRSVIFSVSYVYSNFFTDANLTQYIHVPIIGDQPFTQGTSGTVSSHSVGVNVGYRFKLQTIQKDLPNFRYEEKEESVA